MKITRSKIVFTIVGIAIIGVIGQNIEKMMNKKTTISKKVGIEMFNDPNKLADELTLRGGINEVSHFKDYGDGYFQGGSKYFEFGNPNSNKNKRGYGLNNNLSYYIVSKNQNYVEYLKIILNINNADERKEALENYKKVVSNALKVVEIDEPKGLVDAVIKGDSFEFENSNYAIKSTKEQTKGYIENHEFKITDKAKSPK